MVTGFNNTYVGNFVGSVGAADESDTIRIGDISNGNGPGPAACFIGGIFNNSQPVGGNVVVVTLDLDDRPSWLGCWPEDQGVSAPAGLIVAHLQPAS